MNKFVLGAVAGFGFLGLQAVANTVTWKADGAEGWVDNSSWQNKDNFVEGAAPVAGDTVVIPADKTVTVSDASAEFVSSLARIQPSAESSHVVITLDGTAPITFNCGMGYPTSEGSEAIRKRGRFVKRGKGEMILGLSSSFANYSSFVVEAGTLRLPPKGYYYHDLSVSNNATLYACSDGTLYSDHLFLDGHLKNTASRQFRVQGKDVWSVVSETGTVEENVQLYINGRLRILSTNNTTAARTCAYYGGIIEVMSFGIRQKASSVGKCSEFGAAEGNASGCGTFRYLGTGETVNHNQYLGYPREGSLTIDAGAVGGLEFNSSSQWEGAAKASGDSGCYILTGDGPKTNVIDGSVARMTTDLLRGFIKRGKGIWRFAWSATSAREGLATVAAEEGTLQYDALYEAGEKSALGLGITNFVSGYFGAYDQEKRVPYSLVLGDPKGMSVPTFEYTGSSKGAWNTTRTIALCGDAVLSNASADPDGKPLPLRLGNFSNIVDRTATLILSGDASEAENQIANVRDGANGKTAVVKVGTGTWAFTGTNNTFTGGLTVSNGLVRVLAPDSKYTWYRWFMKETQGRVSESKTYLLGFYDADWNRVHDELKLCKDYAAIRPGEVAHQKRFANEARPHYGATANRDLDKLFSSTTTDSTCLDFLEYGSTGNGRGPILLEDEESWIRCLIRLDPVCNEASSYDVATYYFNTQSPGKWSVEGSVNGIDWDVLHEVDACPFTSSTQWAFGRTAKATAATASVHTNGQSIVGHGLTTARVIPSGCPVSVAPGATLEAVGTVEVDTMRLDPSGNGTFKGLSYANEGTIVMDAETRGVVSFPCTLINADGTAAAPDLSQWTFESGGRIRNGSLKATADGIEFNPSGLMILVR